MRCPQCNYSIFDSNSAEANIILAALQLLIETQKSGYSASQKAMARRQGIQAIQLLEGK